jgi:uncharacterized membrane protein
MLSLAVVELTLFTETWPSKKHLNIAISCLVAVTALLGVVALARDSLFLKIAALINDGFPTTHTLFDFEVCNNDYVTALIAIIGRDDPSQPTPIAKGWFDVASGQCKVIGTFVKGSFYYTARSERTVWAAKEGKSVCIPMTAFSRVIRNDYLCEKFAVSRVFFERQIEEPKYTCTLTPRPWTYTAFASSRSTRSWGWGTGSEEEAGATAKRFCNAAGCRIEALVREDTCLAVAFSKDGAAWGWSSARTYGDARAQPLAACQRNGTTCAISKESCKA